MADAPAVTLEAIAARIQKIAGAEIDKLPYGDHVVWFGMDDLAKQNADGSMTTERGTTLFQVGQPIPLFPKCTALNIFADEDEIRVYGLPNNAASPDPAKGEGTPRVYHLSKKGPVFFVEKLTLASFETMLGSEWSVVAYDMKPLDRIRSEIGDFLRAQAATGEAPSLYELADLIASGEYEEEEDEEEETPEGTPPTNAPGAPAGESQ